MSKGKVLVTGAAGLFGAHLSRHMHSQGYEVSGLDNFSGGYRDYVAPGTTCLDIDLVTEPLKVEAWIGNQKPEVVYHTAAFAAVCLSPFMRNHTYTQNLVGYSNLLNACIKHGVKKIVHFSSMDVYGTSQLAIDGEPAPFNEKMICMPEDPYGISKLAIEMDLKSAHEQFGIEYNIVRPHNVFGIYQNIWDRYRNVLGIWIRKSIAGEDLTVYGDGSQIRAFSDVQYYMDPLEQLYEHGYTGTRCLHGQVYNIGADNPITILEAARLVQHVAHKFGANPGIVHLEPRNEVHTAYPYHGKAATDLGFKDNTNLEELLTEMYEWALKQPVRQVKTVDYEIEKGLYSYWK